MEVMDPSLSFAEEEDSRHEREENEYQTFACRGIDWMIIDFVVNN